MVRLPTDREPGRVRTAVPNLLVAGLFSLLASCGAGEISAGSMRRANPEAVDLQRFLVLPKPPVVAAGDAAGITAAREMMATLSHQDLRRRGGVVFTRANALPWLTGSTEGRAFLSSSDPRVLVRGTPLASCPEALSETGKAPIAELAGRALERCLAASAPGCGCQVIAAGSILLVKPRELNYATGIAARIRARSLGLDGFLVAEETTGGTVLLRDLTKVVGRMERRGGDAVRLVFGPAGAVFNGRLRKVGFRRGRLAERIYATDSAGNRLVLLIGFDPDELAQLAGAWLAWPGDLDLVAGKLRN